MWVTLTPRGEIAVDLIACAAAVAVLVGLVLVVRRPPAIVASVHGAELVVRFGGWDVVWTFRREVRIPLDSIKSVTVHRAESLWSGWWHRRLGTVVPGTIKAGWFGGSGGRELWDVRAGAEVVDLRLAESSRLRRVVVQVPDPIALVDSLAHASPRGAG
jgi:hypothetical protein